MPYGYVLFFSFFPLDPLVFLTINTKPLFEKKKEKRKFLYAHAFAESTSNHNARGKQWGGSSFRFQQNLVPAAIEISVHPIFYMTRSIGQGKKIVVTGFPGSVVIQFSRGNSDCATGECAESQENGVRERGYEG